MNVPFWKMQGAGNDFIVVDDRDSRIPTSAGEWIIDATERRTGVGADGVILIQSSNTADFRMRHFNPDGGEAEMCGNGIRCAARLASEIGAAPAVMSIETQAGLITAETSGDRVCVGMSVPTDWRMERTLRLDRAAVDYCHVNTGVPHVVIQVADVASRDVESEGCAIRRHADFEPAGTNVNFVQTTGPNALSVRTYERGVEGDTLACGTGSVACALIGGRLGFVEPPVEVTCANGDRLDVDYRLTDSGAENVILLGPAVHVYQGTLQI